MIRVLPEFLSEEFSGTGINEHWADRGVIDGPDYIHIVQLIDDPNTIIPNLMKFDNMLRI